MVKNAQKDKSLIKAWLEASRPRTWPASVSPVLLGWALAWQTGGFDLLKALLCLAVALPAQIASNFANDYFDFKKGADTDERLGPERAVASGWITPRAMLKGTFVALVLACMAGLVIVCLSGWWLMGVGIAIALCVLAYSAGPYPLAYNGLGDVCVLLFYGVVPVCFTYYVQTQSFSLLSFILSLSVGFLSINILVVNNYRDYEQDRKALKRTTIVLFGKSFGRIIYLVNGLAGILAGGWFIYTANKWLLFLWMAYILLFLKTWRNLCTQEGQPLNKTLARTAMNVSLFTLILIIGLLV